MLYHFCLILGSSMYKWATILFSVHDPITKIWEFKIVSFSEYKYELLRELYNFFYSLHRSRKFSPLHSLNGAICRIFRSFTFSATDLCKLL